MIMKILVVLVIGCHASTIRQDQPEDGMDLMKNALWKYVSQATRTADDTIQMIKNSKLGQEVNDRISKSADAINGYNLAIQSQVTQLTEKLLAELSQEADQLKLFLEQEMTSMQSQLKPYVEEVRADIEEQVEWLKKDVASKGDTLNSEALKSILVHGVEELKAKLERCFLNMSPQSEEEHFSQELRELDPDLQPRT